MSLVPVWLLDIDGVINVVSEDPAESAWPSAHWCRFRAVDGRGREWPMVVAEPVVDFLWQVHDEELAEIRWHTTWQRQASDVGAALGLPDFPIQACPEFDRYDEQRLGGAPPVGETWWKLPAAERVLADEGRPLLWTDDDAREELARPGARDRLDGTHLILSPRANVGLTPGNLRIIDAFLRGRRP